MGYKLSGKAQDDIINVYLDGIRDFGPVQAEKYHNELETVFEFLADNPRAGVERKEITPIIRVHPHESHVIVYLIEDDNTVFILRIRHHREDWKETPV